MGFKDFEPVLKIIRSDPEYDELFRKSFGKSADQVSMNEVKQALATFERTLVGGDSPFDRYFYGGDPKAMKPAAIRGLKVFVEQGRCVSCHVIEQTQALFTDNRFHMIGVAAQDMPKDLDELSAAEIRSGGIHEGSNQPPVCQKVTQAFTVMSKCNVGTGMKINRRGFLKASGAALVAGALPMSLVEVAFGAKDPAQDFTFAYISDAHIQQIKGREFVRNWDMGLIRAIREANLLQPRPDFFFFGGDLAQLGKKEEIDHGLEIMSALRGDVKYVIGEHDYYLDLGKYWIEKVSPLHYSFYHKGVHFVALDSILTYDDWTHNRWKTPMERMLATARLDNPAVHLFWSGKSSANGSRKILKRSTGKHR